MASRLLGVAGALSILIGLGPATAHAKGEYSRPGPFAAIQGVVAIPTWEDELNTQIAASAPGTPPASLSVSGGFDMRAGYRVHERIAGEMGFDWISAYPITIAGAQVAEASNWMFYVGAKLYLLTEHIQPHLTLGMGAYHLDYALPTAGVVLDGTSFSPRFGAGLDWYVDWRWGLTTEIDYVIGTRQLVDRDRVSISFGAFYRF